MVACVSVCVFVCLCMCLGGCITGNKRSISLLNVTFWPWIKCSSGPNTMKPLSSAPRTALHCTDCLTACRREEDRKIAGKSTAGGYRKKGGTWRQKETTKEDG